MNGSSAPVREFLAIRGMGAMIPGSAQLAVTALHTNTLGVVTWLSRSLPARPFMVVYD